MIIVLDDDTGLIVHHRGQCPQRREWIGLVVNVGNDYVVKRADIPDVVVLVDLEPQVWKTPAREFDLPFTQIDADAKARRNGVQEIRRETADLQDPLAGRYNEAEKSTNLFVVICVLCNVVGAPLTYPLVMLPDLLHPAFQGGGAKPPGSRGFS